MTADAERSEEEYLEHAQPGGRIRIPCAAPDGNTLEFEMAATPERVWQAIQDAQQARPYGKRSGTRMWAPGDASGKTEASRPSTTTDR